MSEKLTVKIAAAFAFTLIGTALRTVGADFIVGEIVGALLMWMLFMIDGLYTRWPSRDKSQ